MYFGAAKAKCTLVILVIGLSFSLLAYPRTECICSHSFHLFVESCESAFKLCDSLFAPLFFKSFCNLRHKLAYLNVLRTRFFTFPALYAVRGFSVFLSEIFVVLAVNRKIFICSAFFLVIKSKVLWYRNVLRTACRTVAAACAGHGYRSFYNVYCLAYDFEFFL